MKNIPEKIFLQIGEDVKENKLINSIIEKFGGDQKESLKNSIISLLVRHDKETIKQVQKAIENITE